MNSFEQKCEAQLAIVVLNWNGWEDTIECLESIFAADGGNCLVVVVDNGSSDNSVDRIKAYCRGEISVKPQRLKPSLKPIFVIESSPDEITHVTDFQQSQNEPHRRLLLVRNPSNLGYAEGNNVGINCALEAINPDFVLISNNDVVFTGTAITHLLGVMRTHSTAGAVAPVIRPFPRHGGSRQEEDFSVARFWLGAMMEKRYNVNFGSAPDVIYSSDTLQGSCILLRVAALEKVGLFDSSFFLFWEDTDLSLRLRKAGYKLLVSADARVWHKIGGSMKKAETLPYYYFVRNRFITAAKHESSFRFLFYVIIFLVFLGWKEQLGWIIRKQRVGLTAYSRGVIDGLRKGARSSR